MSRSVSISIWNPISSSILELAARGASRRRRARAAWNHVIVLSRNAQHGLEAFREPTPVLELDAERVASGDCQAVVPGATVVVGRVPVAGDETILLEAL